MLNEEKWKGLIPDDVLSAAALNTNLIGPTLPPIAPFTFPTGPTGSVGPVGPASGMGNAHGKCLKCFLSKSLNFYTCLLKND
ncbi:exosporium leader peptide-containing protein [Bacillus wiedmannii]|uniref:exosporium leader peptide-containing protein n=1 Tax=Bacillus wiedmannii TaxID=1890302 RepID=UPI00399CB969